MRKSKHPIALFPVLPTDFIDFILQQHQPASTIIICLTREAFLQELEASIARSILTAESTERHSPLGHHLLNPTLHLVATSRDVNLAFTPTLPHLRAFLATYASKTTPSDMSQVKPSSVKNPILAIWGFAGVHRSTSEHSAQGLSRTLAVAVEAARLTGQQLMLAESARTPNDETLGTGNGGLDPWKEQVPLLSGSVRFGDDGSGLGGRSIEVKAVVGRWCRFSLLE